MRVRRSVAVVAAGVVLVALATVEPGVGATGAAQSLSRIAPTDSDGDGDLDRPDRATASAAAKAEGESYEALSERTETTRTFANPDGTWTDEISSTTMRVKDEAGEWADVDYDLELAADGSLVPKVAPNDVKFGGGGSPEAGRLTLDDGTSLALSWPTTLPEPTIDGGVATYKISNATDLIVSMTPDGFATRIRLNSRPAIDDPVFTLGLRADDLVVDETSAGGLKVSDTDGTLVGSTTELAAWDAEVDDGGDPANVVPVTADLEDKSASGGVSKYDLKLSVDDGFLADPSTVYPVTIDPDVSGFINTLHDTWVRSGTTDIQGWSYRLMVGKIGGDSNTNPAITFIRFPQVPFDALADKTITRASIHLFQYDAGSCSPRAVYMYQLNTSFNENTTVYSNKPAVRGGGALGSSMSANHGRNGCAGGGNLYSVGDITGMASQWSKGLFTNWGLQMSVPAASVGDATYERRFCSRNFNTAEGVCNASNITPVMTISYNTPPDIPTGLRIEKLSPGADEIPCGSVIGNMTDLPRVQAEVTDPDGNTVTPHFEWAAQSALPVFSDVVDVPRTSGATATVALPVGAATGEFAFRARTQDSIGDWSPYTAQCSFTIDRSLPGNPTIEDLPGSWDANVPYNVTFTPGGDDASKTAGYAITFNNATPPAMKQFDADGPDQTRIQAVMPNPDDGFSQKIRLWAYSQSGAISAIPFTQSIEVF